VGKFKKKVGEQRDRKLGEGKKAENEIVEI